MPFTWFPDLLAHTATTFRVCADGIGRGDEGLRLGAARAALAWTARTVLHVDYADIAAALKLDDQGRALTLCQRASNLRRDSPAFRRESDQLAVLVALEPAPSRTVIVDVSETEQLEMRF